jgi:hypothetical protein
LQLQLTDASEGIASVAAFTTTKSQLKRFNFQRGNRQYESA